MPFGLSSDNTPQANSHATHMTGFWREASLFLLILAASRVLILLLLAALVQGEEFTDDAQMHLRMVADPLVLLKGNDTPLAFHPPLLPLLEAATIAPMRLFLSDFYAARAGFSVWELIMALFAALTLRSLGTETRLRRCLYLILVILPVSWMTSVVMAQDEVIAASLLTAVLWLHSQLRRRAVLLLVGIGVVAAKALLLLPLLALLFLPSEDRFLRRATIALTPIVVVYGWVAAIAIIRHSATLPEPALLSGSFGVSLWALIVPWLDLSARQAWLWSSVLSLVTLILILSFRKRAERETPVLSGLTAALLFGVFITGYHVNPEYYIIAVIPLVLVCGSRALLWQCAILSTFPWIVNFFYGVRHAIQSSSSGGKTKFVDLYQTLFPFDPSLIYVISIVLCFVATVWLLRLALLSASAFPRMEQRRDLD